MMDTLYPESISAWRGQRELGHPARLVTHLAEI
jgi:hypothetical protein